MFNRGNWLDQLRQLLTERIVVLDGAAGTSLQDLHLSADDFGGPQFEGCNEYLVYTRPDKIRELHRSFLAAGADIIETNTFGATSIVLAEYGLHNKARELNRIAAELARAEPDAVGGGLDGPDHQEHFGDWGRHFRRAERSLPRTGRRIARRRRRYSVVGDGPGYA